MALWLHYPEMIFLGCSILASFLYAGFAKSKRESNFALGLGILLLPAISLKSWILSLLTQSISTRYDSALSLIDIGHPATYLGAFLSRHHWAWLVTFWDYHGWCIFVVWALLYTLHVEGIESAKKLTLRFLIAPLLCVPFYFWVPASGPALGPLDPPNCFPSLHFAMAWMCYKSLRNPIAGLHVALTALATLGLGQHYLIDLIVAIPFAEGVYLIPEGWRSYGAEAITANNPPMPAPIP